MQTRTAPIINTLTIVFGSIQAALAFAMGATILSELPESVAFGLAVASFITGTIQAGLKHAASAQTTPADDVVEVKDGGDILAGPANDMVTTGHHVRTIGVG